MKSINLILIAFFIFFGKTYSQNNEAKADDAARISISPQVSDLEIPQSAKNMLLNKMKEICVKNGMSGDGQNPFFIMDASVDLLNKELTPTAPPMHALNLQVNFTIADTKRNNVFSQTSIEIKGVGKNETKAYMQALKNINPSKGQFKAFMDQGKVKILEFYNSECDFIVSKAMALKAQGNYEEALKVLLSVPEVSKECYVRCMELAKELNPELEVDKNENTIPEEDLE